MDPKKVVSVGTTVVPLISPHNSAVVKKVEHVIILLLRFFPQFMVFERWFFFEVQPPETGRTATSKDQTRVVFPDRRFLGLSGSGQIPKSPPAKFLFAFPLTRGESNGPGPRHAGNLSRQPRLPSLSPCTGSRLPGLTRQGGKRTLQRPKTRRRRSSK